MWKVRHRVSGVLFACKYISKTKLSTGTETVAMDWKKEFESIKMINSDFVVRAEEMFDDTAQSYIVIELCDGTSLAEVLAQTLTNGKEFCDEACTLFVVLFWCIILFRRLQSPCRSVQGSGSDPREGDDPSRPETRKCVNSEQHTLQTRFFPFGIWFLS